MKRIIQIGIIITGLLLSQLAWGIGIHDASKGGVLQQVKDVLQNDPDAIQLTDYDGNTALHLAAAYDHPKIVAFLLTQPKINSDAINVKRETPLYLSARYAGIDTFTNLLEAQSDHKTRAKDQTTLLHACSRSVHEQSNLIAQRILQDEDLKADMIKARDSWGSTPLHIAARSNNHLVAKLLIEHNALVNATDYLGRTPLHWAAEAGHSQTAELLISNGALIDILCTNNGTPLHLAVLANRIDMVKLLLQANATPQLKDANGKTAIRIALEMNHRDIVNMLINFHELQVSTKNESNE